ncbi:MAG: bacterial Ig-like domain-containing protein [Clostridia bacterium]|nr:bacterial Ig-like domain-containing protein [Clostridia bacterium]
MKKKILALALMLTLLAGFVPFGRMALPTVSAADNDEATVSGDLTISNAFSLYEDMHVSGNVTVTSGGTLDLKGHTLTVDGNFTLSYGNFTLNGGTLNVGGNAAFYENSSDYSRYFAMTNKADRINISGDLTTALRNCHVLSNGEINIEGNWTNKANFYTYYNTNLTMEKNIRVNFVGSKDLTITAEGSIYVPTIGIENTPQRKVSMKGSISAGLLEGGNVTITAVDNPTLTFTTVTGSVNVVGNATLSIQQKLTLSSIAVQTPPTRLAYQTGETIDTTGLVLTATYNNGTTKEITEDFTCEPAVLEEEGTQTVTVTYRGKTTTFDVTVEKVLDYLIIKNEPDQLNYNIDETLNTDGLALIAVYKDQSMEEVTSGFTCTPTAFTKAGKQTITVTYRGGTATFDVNVSNLLNYVTIKNKPTRLTYGIGETLDTSGLTLLAIYRDKSTEEVTEGFVCEPSVLNTIGTQTITVTYGGKTTAFDVTVSETALSSIAVRDNPAQTVYKAGDNLDTTDLVLTAAFSNGSTQDVTEGFTCEPTVLNTTGTQTITVTYKGKTTTFDVNVMAKNPLVITRLPETVAVKSGMTAAFSVEATGEGLTYQWQLSDDQGLTWRNSKTTVPNYSATVTDSNNGRYVRCVVSDKYGNKVTSSAARMKITSLKITEQPSPVTAKAGDTVTFKVKAYGPGISYQWQLSDDQGKTWRNSSTKAATYSTTLSDKNNGRYLHCIVTDKYGNSVKSDATYMKISSLAITGQPVNTEAPKGGNVTFNVTAKGPGITYQWQLSDDQGKTWRNSSTKTATYSTTLSDKNNGRYVRCIVTDKYGNSVISAPASMTAA